MGIFGDKFKYNFKRHMGFDMEFDVGKERLFVLRLEQKHEPQHLPSSNMMPFSPFGYNLPPKLKVEVVCHPSNSTLEIEGPREVVENIMKKLQGIEL